MALDAALQHLCAKKHKIGGSVALGVDEKPALRFLYECKCGENLMWRKFCHDNMEQ